MHIQLTFISLLLGLLSSSLQISALIFVFQVVKKITGRRIKLSEHQTQCMGTPAKLYLQILF